MEKKAWEILSFPAIAEEDETHVIENIFGTRVVSRQAGEALHPQLLSLEKLAEIRQSMTEYDFAGQYQQRPIPLGGAIVKLDWLKFYEPHEVPEHFMTKLQSWDTANKATDLSDFSVCTTWGIYDNRYYLLHVFRKRLNFPELKVAVHDLAREYRPISILIEDKASGTPLIQDLHADGLRNVKPYLPPSGTDKIMRLHLQTPLFANGQVLLPRQAPWLADYIAELTGFPATKFDDQVDSTTQALQFLKEGSDKALQWARFGEAMLRNPPFIAERRF